jgi:hypothetical protein
MEEQMLPAQLGGQAVDVPQEPTDRHAGRQCGLHQFLVAADVHGTCPSARRRQRVAVGRGFADRAGVDCVFIQILCVRVA